MCSPERKEGCPVCPSPVCISTSQVYVCVFTASLCFLPGGIDELAYISTNECRFDGQEKSVVCTVSSDSTVRAWDVQEVSQGWDQGATHWISVRSIPFASSFIPCGHLLGGGIPMV